MAWKQKRNPFYDPELERRAQSDINWQGWTALPRNEPFIWVEVEDDEQPSRPGPEPELTDEQSDKAIGWLLEKPERLKAKQDTIVADLNKLLDVDFKKTFWRKRAIGPAKEKLAQLNPANRAPK
jgi:hypothetical protein